MIMPPPLRQHSPRQISGVPCCAVAGRQIGTASLTPGGTRLRIATIAVSGLATLCLAGACRRTPDAPATPGVPARIVAGRGDTVVVNNRRPARLPVRVLDAAGHALPDTAVRFAWASGDTISVSARGEVTCARRGDATVRATLGRVTTPLLVRCRPVEAVRFPGPIQFVVGDSARAIPVTAYGPDNRPVHLLAAQVRVGDTSIVALDGMRVRPRAWGATVLSVSIGDHQATTGVHVYAPATTLEGLAREPRLIAVPLRLAPGEMRRWPLPPGGWSLSMWPEEDEGRGPQLRIEGAGCGPMPGISRRRFGCWSKHGATVIVYAPWRAGATSVLTGILAVKPDGETLREARARRASVAQTP